MELKNRKYHPSHCQNSFKIQSEIKTADIAKIDILTSWLGTDTSMKSGGGKLDRWSLISPISVLTEHNRRNEKSRIPYNSNSLIVVI